MMIEGLFTVATSVNGIPYTRVVELTEPDKIYQQLREGD